MATINLNEVRNIFIELAKDDPSLLNLFTTSPAYRFYYHKGHRNNGNRYFWTTDPVQHNEKPRYVSGIYRYIKTKKSLKLTSEHYHAKRKDAKARALKLWKANQPKEAVDV